MDIKIFLSRYKTASLALDAHTDQFDALTSQIDHYKNMGNGFKPLVQRLIEDLARLADKVHADIAEMEAARTEIKTALDKISDEQGRLILYYRFCQGMTETETAKILGCSRSYITKAVPVLLQELDNILV